MIRTHSQSIMFFDVTDFKIATKDLVEEMVEEKALD